MDKEINKECEITREDLRKARAEIETYIDVTEEDLMKIYSLATGYARERRSQEVPVAEVMTRDVVAVKTDADIHEAARLLSEQGVGALPVVDEENHVTGVLTDSDLLFMLGVKRKHGFKDLMKHILGEPCLKHQKEGKVSDFMTSPAVVVTPDQDIREAARLLEQKRIKRLPVVDEQNRLVGIITRADVLRGVVRL
jgi:CBS-domain-containing membrane protein